MSSLDMFINMLNIYVSIDTFICYVTLTYHLCHIGNISCTMSHQTQSSLLYHLGILLFCHIGIFIIILPLWHIYMLHRQIHYFCLIDMFIIHVSSENWTEDYAIKFVEYIILCFCVQNTMMSRLTNSPFFFNFCQ